jgi:hypothetical protein
MMIDFMHSTCTHTEAGQLASDREFHFLKMAMIEYDAS